MTKKATKWAQKVEIRALPPSNLRQLQAEARLYYSRNPSPMQGEQRRLVAYFRHQYTNYDSLHVEARRRYYSHCDAKKVSQAEKQMSQLVELDRAIALLKSRVNSLAVAEIRRLQTLRKFDGTWICPESLAHGTGFPPPTLAPTLRSNAA